MKTLLVRLSSMGDLIHTLPAISDLAIFRADVELHWLCEASFADIARLHPFVQRIHIMSWRQWRKRLWHPSIWHELRSLKATLHSEQFDNVLDSQSLLKSALFAHFAHAPVFGLDKNSARESLAATLYQQTFTVEKGHDAVWRNRQLFAQVFDYQINDKPNFGIVIPPESSLKGLPQHYRVALTAASRDNKLWAAHNWCTLLSRLHQEDGLPVLLPWGNATEHARTQALAKQLPFVHVCPKLSLLHAADMLSRADSVIGVDTGLLHLANATNRPLVGIYTASDPTKTGIQTSPWAENVGNNGHSPDVDTVLAAVQRGMNHAKQAGII